MCDNKYLRILVLNVTIDPKNFALLTLYNTNTENEQEVLNALSTMTKTIDINKNTHLLLAGDFNVFLVQT